MIVDFEDIRTGSFKVPGDVALAIGVFDGIHVGHQALLDSILKKNLISAVATFKQNPKDVLNKKSFTGNLMTLERKIEIFTEMGISLIILIDFSLNFSKITGNDFLFTLWKYGSIRHLTIGHDFRCGYCLDTDAKAIRAFSTSLGFETEIVEPVTRFGHPVSSSRIRQEILSGRMNTASDLLQRPYEIDVRNVACIKTIACYKYDRLTISQIVPKNGSYFVDVNGLNSNELLEIDDSFLNLYSQSAIEPKIIQFSTQRVKE